jgi:two-component system invasion response regulator UvrY
MTRLLVADRNETIRLGIRSVLKKVDRNMVIDEVLSATEMFERLKTHDYDLLIIELAIGEGEPVTLIPKIRQISPQPNILVFSNLDEKSHGREAIRLGAKGYIMKTCTANEFIMAADRVRNGNLYISPKLAEELALKLCGNASKSPHKSLTERELIVFSMLVCGKRVSEIAHFLRLSIKTVSTHKARIMAKLSAASLSELVQYAIVHHMFEECRVRSVAILAQYEVVAMQSKLSYGN